MPNNKEIDIEKHGSGNAAAFLEDPEQIKKEIGKLKAVLECDNIAEGTWAIVNEEMAKHKRSYVKAVHHKGIWYDQKRELWTTNLFIKKEVNGKQIGENRKITSKTQKGLYDKLYEHYTHTGQIMTWQNVFENALPSICGRNGRVSDNTKQEHARLWNKYWKDAIGDSYIKDVSARDWRELLEKTVIKNDMTRKQFSNAVTILNHMMKFCLSRGILESNPIRDLIRLDYPYKPEVVTNTIKTEGLTAVQMDMIEEWCDLELERQRVEKVYIYTIKFNMIYGLRFGELAGLYWSDVDFENDSFTVCRQRCRQVRMNDDLTFEELQMQDIEHVKAYEENRTLPLSPEGRELLLRIMDLELSDTYVFPIRRNTYAEKIKKAAAYAGIDDPDKIRPHSLRAAAAGRAYRKSSDVKVVQSLLGHRNPEMTYKYIKDIDAFDSLKAIL